MDQNGAQSLLEQRRYDALRHELSTMHAAEVVGLIEDMPEEHVLAAFRLLPKDQAVEVFEQLDPEQQRRILEAFTTDKAQELLQAMSPDDRAALLDEVPAMVAKRLLQHLSPQQRASTLALLGYEEESAGRIMTPDYIDLRRDMTVAQSLERIRKLALRRETIYVAYVIDDQRHLLGTVSLKDLVIAPPEAKLGDIMTVNPKWVSTHTDQEEVAQVLRDYDILAVPVVDAEERLVGIVTWDDVVDIMEQETTEDIYRLGALQGGEQGNYFTTSILNVMRRRVVWLLLLVLVNTVTGSIIGWHNDLLQQFVILTIFIPLVMGTGGNVGAQSSTVVIRGLATGEIKSSEAAKIVAREVSVGLAMGVIIGVLAFSWAFAWRHQIEVAVSVGLALLGISAMATFVGVTLPFLFRLFKVDPALVSAPLITTVMDIFGITFYLVIATIMLRGIL